MYLSVNHQNTDGVLLPYSMENEKGPILAGSKAYKWKEDTGSLLLQELKNEHYCILLTQCFFPKKEEIVLSFPGDTALLLMAIESKLAYTIGTKRGNLKQGQCILANTKGYHCIIVPEKNKQVRFMLICYQPAIIKLFTPYFPFLESPDSSNPVPRLIRQDWINKEMIRVLDDLLLCQYGENLRSFFFDNKVRDLLFLLLARMPNKLPGKGQLSEEEKEKIYKARHLILSDITQHFSIRELARKVGLNELKLKIGFKEIFGMGPFSLLKNERMIKAHRLLEETNKPIKEIASIAGYDSPTSFLNSFKKHFGYNTKDIRMKGKIDPGG